MQIFLFPEMLVCCTYCVRDFVSFDSFLRHNQDHKYQQALTKLCQAQVKIVLVSFTRKIYTFVSNRHPDGEGLIKQVIHQDLEVVTA